MLLAGVIAGEVATGGGGGVPTLVAHTAVQQASAFTQPAASGAINTGGANFLAMAINSYDGQNTGSPRGALVWDSIGSATLAAQACQGTAVLVGTDLTILPLTSFDSSAGSNGWVGLLIAVNGFSGNPFNNGYWFCTASSTAAITVTCTDGSAGTTSATGVYLAPSANTWVRIPASDLVADFGGGSIWYAANATVGSSHYFAEDDRPITAAGDGSSFAVVAFSGVKASSPYVQNVFGSQIGSGTTVPGAAITPTTGNLLLCYVTGLSLTGTFTVDVGFTTTDVYAIGVSLESPVGLAYLVPGSASPVTPTWTLGAAIGNRGRCQVTEFKHS